MNRFLIHIGLVSKIKRELWGPPLVLYYTSINVGSPLVFLTKQKVRKRGTLVYGHIMFLHILRAYMSHLGTHPDTSKEM